MGDKLKQFIDDNRDAFDSEIPDPGILKKLRGQLEQGNEPKKKFGRRSFQWAAVFAGLIMLSVVFYYATQNRNGAQPVVPRENASEITTIPDPVYAKQIDQYKELIGLQQTQLKQIAKEQPQLYHQFESDIRVLDSTYQLLKKKLAENPNTEILLEAMIQNLQLQTDLLNRQLIIIKEIKQKNTSHEKSTV